MRLRGRRRGLTAATLVVLPALAGCGALGLGSAAPGASVDPAGAGDSWVVVQQGSAGPSAAPSRGTASSPPASPSFLGEPHAGCPDDWSSGSILIPLQATVGTGSITATWPRRRDSPYRIAAVPQDLVSGAQPAVVWQPVVTPKSGCTVTATVSGLTSGEPYIIWLDAPDTGFESDGAQHPYSGRSGVLYPN